MRKFQQFFLVLRGVKVAAANLDSNPAPLTLLSLATKRFSSVSPSSSSSSSSPNSLVVDYLTQTLGFSQTQANSISKRLLGAKSTVKPQAVVLFLRDLGFSEPQIRNSVRVMPRLLLSDIDKTLKPKVEFFQQLGLVGADLAKVISRNSKLLACSLEKTLVPWVEVFKKTLTNDGKNGDLVRVLRRCSWFMCGSPELLRSNIEFLQSCGIVGSQLSTLLTRQPRLFGSSQSTVKDRVARAVDMGFTIESRMLVYALYSTCGLSDETWKKKFEFFQSWGFTEQECIAMFRKAPGLLRFSKEKLESEMEFFMNTIKLEKTTLVHRPIILTFSIENRVIPRCKVLQILESKCMLEKTPKLVSVLCLANEAFMDKFILRYADHVDELLLAYKGHRSG